MTSKILFTDLDDTLLDENKGICQENREKIAQMLEQGHYFVITTYGDGENCCQGIGADDAGLLHGGV